MHADLCSLAIFIGERQGRYRPKLFTHACLPVQGVRIHSGDRPHIDGPVLKAAFPDLGHQPRSPQECHPNDDGNKGDIFKRCYGLGKCLRETHSLHGVPVNITCMCAITEQCSISHEHGLYSSRAMQAGMVRG